MVSKQTTMAEIKPITIRDAQLSDINKFNNYKDRHPGTTSGYVFNILCQSLSEDGKIISKENNTNNDQVNELNQMLNDLQQVNITLSNEIETLKNKSPETKTIEVEKQLTGTQFVFEPSPELFKKMHRSISYMIKTGKMNKGHNNLPGLFTQMALEYFVKNEFNHILK